MQRYFLLLCGIIATGDSLKFGGRLFFISPHRTVRAKPFCTLPAVSSRRHCRASGRLAVGCAPYWSASMICSVLQFGPQSTGQPCSAYESRSGVALCSRAKVRGHMRPSQGFDLPICDVYMCCLGSSCVPAAIAFLAISSASECDVIVFVMGLACVSCFCAGGGFANGGPCGAGGRGMLCVRVLGGAIVVCCRVPVYVGCFTRKESVLCVCECSGEEVVC